jgi:predicted transposase YbfD/YdcC
MNREDWNDFYRWLDTANLEELRTKKSKIENLLEILKEPHVHGEARRMRRKIEEEILLRLLHP